ncbi:methyltransferase domain-containing protein [Candidatus Woesearchaeota archaeon]|nr:methyltransferase domain-containing protein [Candidatus Woesearchaeota archaeon]
MKQTKNLVMTPDGRKFFTNLDQDIHTTYGVLRKEELKGAEVGDTLQSNIGKKFFFLDPGFKDHYSRMKRTAQIIHLKDAGYILATTLVGRESKVLDAGAGSGYLAVFLARYVKKVYTCDIRDDHLDTVRHNVDYMGMKNIEVIKQDVYERIRQKNLDLIVFDLPEPHRALANASKALKPGAFLVIYNPCITQVTAFLDELDKHPEFLYLKTVELIHRDWEAKGKKVRPDNKAIGHTGFLCFCRKLRK